MTWKDILRKGEYLYETSDFIYSQVTEMENAQLDKLAKEYVGIWIDFENNEEKERANPDYEKMEPLQQQITDLLKRTLPDFIKSQGKDLPTDEEFDYFFERYLEDDMYWYLTTDIIGYRRE